MTLRRYAPMKKSMGTAIPAKVRTYVKARDLGCVGPKVGMPDPCFGGLELDHVRNAGMGRKSESVPDELVTLCAWHHRIKTENGKTWRPVLLQYIASKEAA